VARALARRRRRIVRLGVAASAVAIAPAAIAAAQSPPAGRLDISGGFRWTAGMFAGEQDATETAPNASRYRLFSTRSTLAPAPGLEGRVAVRVSRTVDAAFSAAFAKSDLKTSVTSDVEGFPDVEATESVSQVALEGAVLINVPSLALSDRALPFVTAGGGLLRQLHQGRTLVETGAIYHVGAGLTYVLRPGGAGLLKSSGVRFDARAVIRRNGVAFADGSHLSPAFGVSFFGRF
jgi:hypothetical protein